MSCSGVKVGQFLRKWPLSLIVWISETGKKLSEHYADRLLEYFALNANNLAIDPIMLLLRAAVRVNPNSMIKTMAVARLNSAAIISSGPLELLAKDFWSRIMSTMPFASKGSPFGEMLHAFFSTIISADLLNYALTPPGKWRHIFFNFVKNSRFHINKRIDRQH